jgi:hypothetical protein
MGGWLLFQPRNSAPDLVVARDRLMASDALVATFRSGGAEGYRFTSLKDLGWVWDRTSGGSGEPLADAILYAGGRYLLRITDGCFIQIPTVKPPLVPGLTVSQKLVNQPGLHGTAGSLFAYNVDATAFARANATLISLQVTENLAPLRSGGALFATTGEPPGPVWPGDYSVRRASAAEQRTAQDVLKSATPSDYAELVIEERIVGTTILNNSTLGPYRIVIPEACPDHATLLSAGIQGGQAEGLRSSPSPLRFLPGSPMLIDQAFETGLKFRAPVDAFNAAAAGGSFGTVPVTSTNTIISRITGGGFLGLQIDSCSSKPWFSC